MEIRKFKDDDGIKVSEIIKKALKEVNSRDYPEEVINYMGDHFSPKTIRQLARGRDMFVGVIDSEIIGTIALGLATKNSNEGKIRTLFVDPKFHGKGIGRQLVNHIEKVAKDKGYKRIKTAASNSSTEFYQKLGYNKIKEENHKFFGQLIILEKAL